jgi:hypothetical protein
MGRLIEAVEETHYRLTGKRVKCADCRPCVI